MSKISTYEVAPVPKLADKLIGTSVGGEIENITYNFTLQELLELFLPIIPANNLQGVLDYGNTATQDINLFGTITTTNLDVTDTANLFITYLNEETHIVGSVFDSVDSVGTAGQVLTSTGDGVEWFTLPPIFTPNLQQVLEVGNTANIDILLDANIEALDVSADTATVEVNLTIGGTITDNNSAVGSSGQVLSSTVTGVSWVSLPVYSATSPLLFNPATGVFSIQVANGTQGGYLTANDWVTFNGKQDAGNYITALTGEATASGPGSASVTLNNASVTGKVLTGLNVTGGNVVATDSILTAFGKVQNQINGLVGGVQYQGVWNANTNTPTLTSSVGTQGHYYIVNVAGTTNLNGITDWQVGDWAIFSGGAWQKVDNTDSVTSVNGFTGAVSLTTDNIPEGTTNLYYLDSRARAALSFAAGSGAYNNTTGVITIPTDNNQILNGANYIVLGSLSANSPLSYNNTTGAFSIQVANSSQNGYLSSTDWTTFNSKQGAITLTTIGSSGPSTLVGTTLNIPDYGGALTGYVPYTGATGPVNLGAYDLTVQTLTIGKGNNSLANNTALGFHALFHITTGNYNTAVGYESSHNTTTGQYNTSLGQSALFTNTTGSQNTAIGLNALLYNLTGGSNVVVGLDAMQHNTSGSSNTALGYNAGSHITGGSTPNTTASNSIYIGRDTKALADGGTNEIVIGNAVTGNGSNTVTIGNSSVVDNYFTGSIHGGSFIRLGGTASQFLKANGSIDSTSYQPFITAGTTAQYYRGDKTFQTLDTSVVPEGTNLYFLDSRARAAISLTTTGSSGAATYNSTTGVFNIPNYSGALTGYVPYTGATANVDLGIYNLTASSLIKSGGTSSQFLKADGSVDSSAYIVLGSLSASAPLSYNNTTGAFSISQAGASSNGYLSSADWNTFNNKQATLSLTTTGSSGSSTLVGSTLNVPTYTLSGLGGVPTSRTLTINGTAYDLSADRSWSVGTVTSVAALTLGTTGTDLSSSVATGTTTPVITLNVPTASAANRGALSAADWSTFNTKVGGVTATSPLFSSGGSTPNITIQQSSGSQDGYLSSTDWTTFNNKQAAGNYITSLTGEATGTGPGATAVTLNNASVTAKILTGINITGGTVQATDTMLTAFGKLQNQINGLIGSTIYQGTWNASTNTPALASGVGVRGYYYIVSVAGNTNLDGITDWFIGDWAIFDGTAWQQVDNTDAVVSVNGQTGAVSLTTDNVPEGATNQYYLDSRARAALSFTAGSGAYNSTTGVITIPTNNNQITNGANYITLALLSGTAPIVYSNTTGAISITQAGTASNGYLSSTDWNTFNNKSNTNGTVTSVAALTIGTTGTDLSSTVANSTTTPVITLNVPTASATNRGALSAADWTTFNNKQATITLTTTGTSGAATLVGATLNIPNYGSALSGYLPLSGGTMTGQLASTYKSSTGALLLNSGDDSGAANNYVQIALGYNGSSTYKHYITTTHNNGTSGLNGIRFYTSNGVMNGTFPTDAVLGLTIENGSVTSGSFIKTGGTSSQYLMADGSVSTGPSLTGYVPYTGATANVDLGVYGITAGYGYFIKNINGYTTVYSDNGYSAGAGVGSQFMLKDGGTDIAWLRRNRDGTGITELTNADGTFVIKTAGSTSTTPVTRLTISGIGVITLSNLAGTGTRIVVADASGTLSASSALSGYVPYTGATANVDLGIYTLRATRVAIGGTPYPNVAYTFKGTINGNNDSWGTYQGELTFAPVVNDSISAGYHAGGAINTGTYTGLTYRGFMQENLQANTGTGTLATAYGVYISSLTRATNNYSAYFAQNVGIGTDTPAYLLDVAGTGRFYASQIDLKLNATSTSQYSRLIFEENGSGTGVIQYINSAFVTTARRKKLEIANGDGINFVTAGNFNAPDFSIDTSGNINAVGSITGSIAALGTAATLFVVSSSGTLRSRTAAQVLSDIGGQASGNYVTTDTTQSISGLKTFTAPAAGGTGDYTNMTSYSFKVSPSSGYWRIPFLSNDASISGVFNFETGKNVYWGEPSDTGIYYFRGRTMNIQALSGTSATFSSTVTVNGGNVLVTNVASSGYAFTSVAASWGSTSQIYTAIKIGAAGDNLVGTGVDLRAYSQYGSGAGTEFRLFTNNTSNVLTEALRIASNQAATFSSTISASTSISVANNGAQNALLSATSTYADGYDAILQLNNTHTGGKNWNIRSTNDSQGNFGGGKLVFSNQSASAANATMILTSTGNVGIGTSTPSQLMEIKGTAPFYSVYNMGGEGGVKFRNDGGTTLWNFVHNNGDGNFYFREAVSSLVPLTLTYSTGNVGIRNTSPQAYLDVMGVADQTNFTSIYARAGNSDGSTPLSNQILFGYSGSANYSHGIKTRHQSGSQAGNSIEFWVWKYGDAIGTPAGQRVMVVEGNAVRIANGSGTINSLSASERLNVNGTVYATGYYETSDIRLKNVLSTTDGNIPAISYTWKDGRDNKLHWGYAAQDVMKYLPDAVSGSEYYGLDYNQVHTYKIAIIEDEVTILKRRVAELESKLQS